MKKVLFPVLLAYTINFSFSQTIEERRTILKSNDAGILSVMQKQVQAFSLEKEQKIEEFFKKNPEVLRRYEKNNVIYEIAEISPMGTPLYYRTLNEGSSRTIQASSLYTGGNLGLNVNGENMVAGIWDAGLALPTHVEFPGSKITAGDGITKVDQHSTHVAGTIAAKGIDTKAKGIASKATVISYDWTNDIKEMSNFAANGYLASNHSYGLTTIDDAGYVLPTLYFGSYMSSAYQADLVAYANKNYQIVKAAGNDGGNGWYINPHKHGYELITSIGISKNVLTVAAVDELLEYKQPSDVKIAAFSSPGPTDDGRIKPNISAKGVSVYSTINAPGNNSYGRMSGTSMSSPAITGSILLLQEHYKNLNTSFMRSATVRGLLQHTALEAGLSDGPDYKFGWGLADIKTSAQAITGNKTTSLIEENILENNKTYTKVIRVNDDTKPLIVSISWTDLPAKNYNSKENDPNVLYLVNDLDIRVTDPSGKTCYPWKLDGKNPSLAATKGDNIVDNFERIDIPNPIKGTYTITVSHKKSLQELDASGNQVIGNQEYSLIITGSGLDFNPSSPNPPSKVVANTIYPNPAKDILNITMQSDGKYEIYEITGKYIGAGKLLEGENTINVSNLTKGIYIIKLKNGAKSHTHKIIIE